MEFYTHFEAERNPEDSVVHPQGKADQRLLIPLPHSPPCPIPSKREAGVGG